MHSIAPKENYSDINEKKRPSKHGVFALWIAPLVSEETLTDFQLGSRDGTDHLFFYLSKWKTWS